MQRVDVVARILDATSQASGVRDIWKKTREEDKTKANAIEEENRWRKRRKKRKKETRKKFIRVF